MDSVATKRCTVCESQSVVKAAVKWCSECDEAFCSDCLKYHSNAKSTKSHAVIDVSDLLELPEFALNIKQHCGEHGALFQNYCLSHERPCCRKCINSTHKNCTDMPPLDDVIKDVRNSTAVEDIQERLQYLKEYYKRLGQEKESNAEEIKSQSITIISNIASIRNKLNRHLDHLEREILQKVSELQVNTLQSIEHISKKLKSNESWACELWKDIIKMRNHASELQVFLGTKEIEIEISKREKEIEEMTKAYSLSINSMILHENEKLSTLISEVSSFGEITIDIKPSKINYTNSKGQQAQISIERRTFDDLKIKLKLSHKLEFKATTVIGSAILENDTVCFSQRNKDVLTVANTNGSILYTIKLPQKLYDITHVKNQTVAVTTGSNESQMLIVDLKTRSLEKTIKTKKSCYGISFGNGSLIHHSTEAGLLTLNLENGVVAELGIGNKVSNVYVAVHDGKIYCTNKGGPSVQCYNDDKSVGWEFKDTSLIAPRGIAVDEKGIVYVCDQASGNVVIISQDGSIHEAVKIESIPRPRTISFNKTKTRLLICGLDGQAGIFIVS